MRAGDLAAHPRNWRRHDETQTSAVRRMIDRVGYVAPLIARLTEDGGLLLIDGHLRAGLDPEQEVPVLVTDLSDDEALKVLATLDPMKEMAIYDEEIIAELRSQISDDLDDLLDQLKLKVKESEDRGLRTAASAAPPSEMICPHCGHEF